MARSTAVKADEVTVEETVVEPVEGTVEETVVEGTEGDEPTETPAETPTEPAAEPEKPIDLGPFTAAVTEALENSDESTGDVPEASLAKVREIYQGLDGIKPKNAAKQHLASELRRFLTATNGPKAKAIMELTEKAAVAGKSGGTTERKPADPTEGFVSNVAALTLALYLAQRQVPEGQDAEALVAKATEQANGAFEQALTVQASENQETDSVLIRNAIRLAATKAKRATSARVASGERRDLGAHIAEAFAAADEGKFLLVSDIRNFKSSVYGDDHPSAGAITNRLEPKSGKPTTISGIRVERREGKLGAVKVGAVSAAAEDTDES